MYSKVLQAHKAVLELNNRTHEDAYKTCLNITKILKQPTLKLRHLLNILPKTSFIAYFSITVYMQLDCLLSPTSQL